MKLKSFILFIVIFSSINFAQSACREYREISRQADMLSMDLEDLRFEIRVAFPHSWNLYDLVQRSELDATFLYRTTRSGALPCWQTKSNFSRLQKSTQILRNYFRNFSRRRNISRVEYEWRRFIDSYRRLESVMAYAREE